MFTIGQFARLAKVSARTIRHYEAIGLLSSSGRGENNYRQFDSSQLDRIEKIRELQRLGFSLDEIQKILTVSNHSLIASLRSRLTQTHHEIKSLQLRKSEIEKLLSISTKIDSNGSINDIERRQYMSAIREEILGGLQAKLATGTIDETQLSYVERDENLYSDPHKSELILAVKKCVEFAKERGLTLGPGRGSSPSSIALFAFGFSSFDPSKYGLMPERLSSSLPMDIHIDVQFDRGQEFVEFCRHVSSQISYGQINAFKMPLIDIIKNVHTKIGTQINYHEIPDDSDIVLSHFRNGLIEKIFGFDMSPHSLIMKYENLLPDYLGVGRLNEYLRSQKIRDFRDVVNISALWRPHCPEMTDRIERYRQAKTQDMSYVFLPKDLQRSLKANSGMLIYHEDILRIMNHYSKWSLGKCNQARRILATKAQKDSENGILTDLQKTIPPEVYDLFAAESPWSFCQSHALAFSFFTKQTAALKSLHREIYLNEISEWEQKHGFTWDDIGAKLNGVSLLQS